MVILVMHPILFHYLSVKIPLIKFSILKTIYLLRKKSLKARLPPKRKRSELSKPDYPISSDSMNLPTVQDFYTAFYTAQRAFDAYQKERSKWEEAYGEKVTPKFETIHDKIKRYQEKSDNQNANRPYQSSRRRWLTAVLSQHRTYRSVYGAFNS